MSTRAGIIVKDETGDTVRFYRHSDGYPEGVQPTLDKFVEWRQKNIIRDNIHQASGWIILLGAAEYGVQLDYEVAVHHVRDRTYRETEMDTIIHPEEKESDLLNGWKVGAYEPLGDDPFPGDIEHLYEVDLEYGEWGEIPLSRAEDFD